MKTEITKEVLEKCEYFQDTQFWPLVVASDVKQWLGNFHDEAEKEIAAQIVDFYLYFSEPMINHMLATVLGKCGCYFRTFKKDWSDADFIGNCWYSYIPGEDRSEICSGSEFLRKIQTLFGIPNSRLLTYSDFVKKMRESHCEYFILVDDFIGSGHQIEEAWCEYPTGEPLKEICQSHYHRVVYAPLIVNDLGYNQVQRVCGGLHLEYIHKLPTEFSLFNQYCPCWKGDLELYHRGVELIKNKSIELGIPETNGKQINDMKGYREQGLAISFQHGMPDACLPIFTKETLDWKPLFKRHD